MEQAAKMAYVDFTRTKQLARLRSGFLLREILDRFVTKSQSRLSPDFSFWVYSGHDATIFNMLNTLGIPDVIHLF